MKTTEPNWDSGNHHELKKWNMIEDGIQELSFENSSNVIV
jgi:hypothetical protein